MILTLIFIGIFVIGITSLIIRNIADGFIIKKIVEGKYSKRKVWKALYYYAELLGLILTFVGGLCLFFALEVIIEHHIGVNNDIRQDNIRYESLCKKLEIVDSDYEDVSKSEVINDIAGWNTSVVNSQYWARSPWTNWFYSQKRVDNLKLIEY